ncbi:dephospho-CoA kinase [Dokdonella fugitiva]|uniref:Dephospho-CoA kinase n=1 Tax=Dokdonella fugitiva TaxID=328517 RepID=A0A839F3I1_9GAMM|nr:dephospho-CoA kinase [Dokdonella fugitiva]MBA8888389.1 dephospho-CoA kinase [Dokdonella fugitiva]
MTFTVALTGGVASGKSAAATRFAALGANVIDADVVARELVEPGRPALQEIVTAFGTRILDVAGALDRRALRERVFADATARHRLEGILHPRIRDALRQRASAPCGTYAMIVVPLLAENAEQYAWVDRVLVVDVPREVQLARLLARDAVSPATADAMLAAQASREQRLAIADDVIENDRSLADLGDAVGALHARYLAMSETASVN